MTDTIHYGLIGCGMMGKEHIRNIQLQDNVEISAIFEPDPGMKAGAQALAPHAAYPDSIDALLKIDVLDALVIVSPNYMHLQQLEQIQATRPLPTLCEKPLFTDPDDAARVAQFISTYPAPVWVAMEYRYMPPIAKLLEQADLVTGGIRLLTIREHRFPFLQKVGDWNRLNANSGGTLVEKCCHFFDLMRLALKSDPIRVMASAGQEVNHLDEVYDGTYSDIWDCGYVIVDFENGARAMLELCMFAEGSKYQEEISAVGANGKIEALVPGPRRFWPERLGDPPAPKLVVSPRFPTGPSEMEIHVDPRLLKAGDHNGATYYQHQLFLECIRQKTTPAVTLSDGAWAVRMGMAAQESAITGQAVTF